MRTGDKVTLLGKAESNTNVSELMRNVTTAPWLSHPFLNQIKTEEKDGKQMSDFKLQLQLVNPAQDKGNRDNG